MGTCQTLTQKLILESFFLGGAPVNILLLLGSPTGIAALVRISFGCRAFQKTFGAWSWPFKGCHLLNQKQKLCLHKSPMKPWDRVNHGLQRNHGQASFCHWFVLTQ